MSRIPVAPSSLGLGPEFPLHRRSHICIRHFRKLVITGDVIARAMMFNIICALRYDDRPNRAHNTREVERSLAWVVRHRDVQRVVRVELQVALVGFLQIK